MLHLDQASWDAGGPAERAGFATQLRAGLESTGFITLEGHGIDPGLIDRCYAAIARFFTLDPATKARCSRGAGGARGFTGFGIEHARDRSIADLKEFFHLGRELDPAHPLASVYPANCWPDEVPELRAATSELFAALEGCAERLLTALGSAYALPEDTFSRMLQEGNSVLRAVHYPPLEVSAPDGALRAAPHEDINLITLLCEASDAGLEILTPDGWLPVPTPRGQLVVDTGDMLSRVAGGVIPSTTHRVVNPASGSEASKRSRYSIPFFAHPAPSCDLSVHPHFATPEREAAYPPITAGEFLEQRLREIGLEATG